jgi:DNA-binding response OmpR family regulator
MAILVVEDEPDLTDLLTYILRRAGHDVLVAFDGDTALRLFRERDPELVLLDVGLPHKDGWEVCERIRGESNTPVVFLSGNDTEDDIVRGLDLGAEDYVVKPFSPRMLQARIRAVLRRSTTLERGVKTDGTITVGDLALDPRWRTASRGDQSIPLTRIEYRVLQDLALHFGQVVPHAELIQKVWGYKGEASGNIVKGHIRNIRLKLAEIGSDTTIQIVPSVGYLLHSRTA